MMVPPGLSSPCALGVLDHLHGHAVLDRVAGVERLDLDEHVRLDHALGDAVDPHHRRVADGVQDRVADGFHSTPSRAQPRKRRLYRPVIGSLLVRPHLLDRNRQPDVQPASREFPWSEMNREGGLVSDFDERPAVVPHRLHRVGLRRAAASPGKGLAFAGEDECWRLDVNRFGYGRFTKSGAPAVQPCEHEALSEGGPPASPPGQSRTDKCNRRRRGHVRPTALSRRPAAAIERVAFDDDSGLGPISPLPPAPPRRSPA